MSKTVQKKTYMIVITRDSEDDVFVGRCDELHANSFADTFGKIVENMKEVVELAAKDTGNPTDFDMLITER